MKNIILFIVILLFTSCDKLDIIPEAPKIGEINRIELHVQLIEASAIIRIDDSVYTVSSDREHSLIVYSRDTMKHISIFKISGVKVTAAIHDYTKRVIYNLGEIKELKGYRLD